MSTCNFYETRRNKYNMMTILREDDYVYDIEDGSEWKLLEDPNKGGSANSICTWAPEDCPYKVGTLFKRCYFDEFGKLRGYLRRGLNPDKTKSKYESSLYY